MRLDAFFCRLLILLMSLLKCWMPEIHREHDQSTSRNIYEEKSHTSSWYLFLIRWIWYQHGQR